MLIETEGYCQPLSVAMVFFCLFLAPCSQCAAQTVDREAIYQTALPLYADSVTAPLNAVLVSSGSYPECSWQKIDYTGQHGRVPGLFFLPIGVSSKAPVPCIVLLHGLGGSKQQLIPLARFLGSIGYASWAIDDADSGERALSTKTFPDYKSIGDLVTGITELTTTTIVDQRRGLDYLDTRLEIDHQRIGMLGISLGALLGGVLGGVEPRLKAVILISGGGDLGQILVGEAKTQVAFGKLYPALLSSADPVELENQLATIDPINFVAHISPRPMIMEHGRLDRIIPPDTAVALFDAARQPKSIEWFDKAGHPPPPIELYPSISIFLDKYLPLPGR